MLGCCFAVLITLILYRSFAQDSKLPKSPGDFPALYSYPQWYQLEDKMYEHGFPIKPNVSPHFEEDSSIFVTISHYRDGRCATTLDYLFKRAKFPNRVYVGKILLSIMQLPLKIICNTNKELSSNDILNRISSIAWKITVHNSDKRVALIKARSR